VSDLVALQASSQGKLEIEALEEGREDRIWQAALAQAVSEVFRRRVDQSGLGQVVAAFGEGRVVHVGDDLPAEAYREVLAAVPALRGPVAQLAGGEEDPAELAAAVELVLEGLHLGKRLNKDEAGGRAVFRGRG
jgi:magnesium chelatase subunit I